jgi:hypothetical protein
MLQFKQQCCELLQREHPAMSNRRLSFTAAGYIIPVLYALYLSSPEHTALRTSKTHGTQDIKDTRNSGHQRPTQIGYLLTTPTKTTSEYHLPDPSKRPLYHTSRHHLAGPSNPLTQHDLTGINRPPTCKLSPLQYAITIY